MIEIADECCGCATEGYPCWGSLCPNRDVVRMYCDKCGEEVDCLRRYEGEQWCESCILDEFELIELEEE